MKGLRVTTEFDDPFTWNNGNLRNFDNYNESLVKLRVFFDVKEQGFCPLFKSSKSARKVDGVERTFWRMSIQKDGKLFLKATIYDPKSMGPENMSLLIAIIIPQHIILKVNMKNKIK